ncbi:hypothetical protein [Streptomyces sp. NPDC020747]|uniref:GHMP family kinase ATP-binding protein n=1 Tax=Streptomyces sp. NPDC020747 TaxID=3365086 RepID=UPI00378C6501
MKPASVSVSAPLRLSLGGGGCDLPEFYRTHGADVLSVAINRRITVAVHPCNAVASGTNARIDLLAERLPWPTRTKVASPVPPGSGLGGSGALTVALVAAERVLGGASTADLAPLSIGREAYRWEREILGQPVGFQDHMASAFGSLTRMSANMNARMGTEIGDDIAVERQEGLAEAFADMLGHSVRLFPTRQVRNAAGQLATFARNLVADGGQTSLADTPEFVAAITSRDGAEFGRLMRRRWERKVNLNPAAQWPGITTMVADALALGATGAKVVGAGGGGWLMVAGPGEAMPAVTSVLTRRHALTEDRFHIDSAGIKVERAHIHD